MKTTILSTFQSTVIYPSHQPMRRPKRRKNILLLGLVAALTAGCDNTETPEETDHDVGLTQISGHFA